MKTTYVIVIAVVVIAIIIGSVFAYTYLSKPSSANTNPTPTPGTTSTPSSTTSPTGSPTRTSSPSSSPSSSSSPSPTATPATSVYFNGEGATFPQPFLNAVITAYTTANPSVSINYQGVGSGAGISALIGKAVDFAASDAPLSDSQRAQAPNSLHIPETIGAVTLSYNLPGISSGLKLNGDVISKIFLGQITTWNDPAIAALNPGTTLPTNGIATVHRSDSSGTTNIFTKYLSSQSSTWNTQVGSGTSVQWPGGTGQSGNFGVASTVNTTQYAIGYVELAYALQNGMTYASVLNPTGAYIAPSLASTAAAVKVGASGGLPAGDQSWSSVSLLNENDPQAYPIVSFTYIMEYKELNVIPLMTQAKATAIAQFLWYMVHDGQNQASALGYVPLPANVVAIDETTIKSMTFNGQQLIT